SGRVLAEVVACAFDHRDRARVAHAEALTGAARDEELAAGCPIADRVARKHGVVRRVVGKRTDRDDAAAHALGDVVLRLALEAKLDAIVEKRAEALARAAAIVAAFTTSERCAHGPVGVVDGSSLRRGRRNVAVAM